LWNHQLNEIEVKDVENDSLFVSVFASPLGVAQFKSIGTAQIKMVVFTKGESNSKSVKKDEWVSLP
jgi:hypothetical protein